MLGVGEACSYRERRQLINEGLVGCVGVLVSTAIRLCDCLFAVQSEPVANSAGDHGSSRRCQASIDCSVKSLDDGFVQSCGYGDAHDTKISHRVRNVYTVVLGHDFLE